MGTGMDCDDLKIKTVTLTINGRDLMNICNGLHILSQVSKQIPDAPVCDDCLKASAKLLGELEPELDDLAKKDW